MRGGFSTIRAALRGVALLLGAILLFCACGEAGAPTGTGSDETLPAGGDSTADSIAVPEGDPDPLPNSAAPRAARRATVLYTLGEPSSFSDRLTLASLQGLVANACEEQILITRGAYDLYDGVLTDTYGVTVTDRVDGERVRLSTLLSHFGEVPAGYILCDSDPHGASGSVAVSLAGVLRAVVATPENEDKCKAAGLTCLLDVTGKDDAWLRASEYWPRLNGTVAFEQPLSMAPKLVDYAVMSGAYFTFYEGTDPAAHGELFSHLPAGSLIYGYNNTLGEFETVESLSELNLQLVPADHAYNLSTLSGFALPSLEQGGEDPTPAEAEGVHTVCLILSDGDNLQWMLNDFATSKKWYGNPHRGEFPMGWGVPPTAIDTAAPMLAYLYGEQTGKDEFICQLSGLGYTFPSRWSESARRDMAVALAAAMERSDLAYAEILDDGGLDGEVLSAFTSQEAIEGLFYIDYNHYAGERGTVLWSEGKPVVSARYRLWADVPDGSVEHVARLINRASTDVTKEEAYSFIIVHAWSGMEGDALVPGGNTLDAVAALVAALDGDVEVVTPTVFMERIKENISH